MKKLSYYGLHTIRTVLCCILVIIEETKIDQQELKNLLRI